MRNSVNKINYQTISAIIDNDNNKDSIDDDSRNNVKIDSRTHTHTDRQTDKQTDRYFYFSIQFSYESLILLF